MKKLSQTMKKQPQITNKDGLEWLKVQLKTLNRTHKTIQLLKNELSAMGYWKSKPRGDSRKGYEAMQQAKANIY